MSKIDDYRQTLKKLDDWIPFLRKESGLPGPRGNLELAYAVAEEGNEKQFKQFLLENADGSKDERFKVLRQGMGYCWSVAVAALPEIGKPMMEKWLDSQDKNICWMMKENLKKNRLVKMDADWVQACIKRLEVTS